MENPLKNPFVLILSNDKNRINLFKQCIMREYSARIRTVSSLSEAYEILDEHVPHIIISDWNPAHGQGTKLVLKVRLEYHYKETIIFLSSNEKIDSDIIAKALNNGADEFINGNITKKLFRAKLRSFMRIINLNQELKISNTNLQNSLEKQQALKKQLEQKNQDLIDERNELNNALGQISALAKKLKQVNQDLQKSVATREADIQNGLRLLSTLIEARRKHHRGHAKIVRKLAHFIARKLNLSNDEIYNISTAAMLHEIGKYGISDKLAQKKPNEYTKSEEILLSNHPREGSRLLGTYLGEDSEVVQIIRHYHENVDGTGSPQGLKKSQIPIGSRILAVANYIDNSLRSSQNIEKVISSLNQKAGSEFDHDIVTIIKKYLIKKYQIEELVDVEELNLSELEPGMILADSIYTKSGMKILPAETELTETNINTLIRYHGAEPLENKIYIKRNK